MQKNPLISIIIPALEIDQELINCINTATQTLKNSKEKFEILVITPSGNLNNIPHIDEVFFLKESKRGIYSAMNDGISHSNGDYIMFLGKDDLILPSFKKLIKEISTLKKSAIFFNVYWGTEGVRSGKPSKIKILKENICHQGIIYSRESLKKHGPYFRKMKVQADHLLNIKILWDKEISRNILYINSAFIWYSAEGFSSKNKDLIFKKFYPAILKKYTTSFFYYTLLAKRFLNKFKS